MNWLAEFGWSLHLLSRNPCQTVMEHWSPRLSFLGLHTLSPAHFNNGCLVHTRLATLRYSKLEAVGAMMATLHTYSTTWKATQGSNLPAYDAGNLSREVAQLRTAVTLNLTLRRRILIDLNR